MSVASVMSAIAAPLIAPRTIGDFNRWWRSLDINERRRIVETDRKLFGSVGFETGLSADFLAGRYGRKRREDA